MPRSSAATAERRQVEVSTDPGGGPRVRIFSLGYQGRLVTDLQTFVKEHGLRLVDIRHRPFSRNALYNQKALAARVGEAYVHLPALGNVNYKGGPIALIDEAASLPLRALLAEGSIALMCACADANTCHRTVITDRLAAEGYTIEHLPLPVPTIVRPAPSRRDHDVRAVPLRQPRLF
jgi:hypothetical protein